MSHPALWSKGVFFYPIGNTPAVDLLQDLPPEDDAWILSLGCGDPRNILLTLYNRIRVQERSFPAFDITCCDNEPAVLARNALLFTMIIDDYEIDNIWNMFYHFRIDTSSYAALCAQCDNLVESSHSLEHWTRSKYSTFLRFCDRHTLQQLNRHWKLYADTRNFSEDKHNQLRHQISSIRRPKEPSGAKAMPARAAGLFDLHASTGLMLHFDHYWATGIADMEPQKAKDASKANPTFLYSSGAIRDFHYGTYPLGGFLLAEAFVGGICRTKSPKDFVSCAKAQFQSWCKAFKQAVSDGGKSLLRIRLFAGDALAFCHTLNAIQREPSVLSASHYVGPWSHHRLVLDGGDYGPNAISPKAPLTFNVIDTSNLVDHLGLMNVMLAAIPLLSPAPSSTLYAETLLLYNPDDEFTGLEKRLCMEFPAFSLLFGVAPASYLSQFSTQSNTNEIVRMKVMKSQQYHERIAWKNPSVLKPITSSDKQDSVISPPYFDPSSLAKLIYQLYQNLFPTENRNFILQKKTLGMGLIHHHRGTFACLLGFLKRRLQTDWEPFMNALIYYIENDKNCIFTSNFYQELYLQLHLLGVHTLEHLLPNQLITGLGPRGPFKGWKEVPLVVCMVVVFPRSDIRFLETEDFFKLGTPMLQLGIESPTSYNVFSCVQFTFGSINVSGEKEKLKIEVEEDPESYGGKSDLIASVWVTARSFTDNANAAKVNLEMHATVPLSRYYLQRLGEHLTVCSVKVMDRKAVYIVKERPGSPSSIRLGDGESFSSRLSLPSATKSSPTTSVSIDSDFAVSELKVQYPIQNDKEKKALLDGADVKTEQISMSLVRASFGAYHKDVIFPFPVEPTRIRLRIARKSGYIEILAPPARPFTSPNFSYRDLSPLISRKLENGVPVPISWNSHKISLSKSPLFIRRTSEIEWLNPHVSLGFSDRERALRGGDGFGKDAVLTNIKDTIYSLILQAYHNPQMHLFDLCDRERGGQYCLIFLNDFRLDLPNRNIVADCCILPLSQETAEEIGEAAFSRLGRNISIFTAGDETLAWYHLLPTFVERCRTWSHKPTCEYLRSPTGSPPLSDEFRGDPICKCGRGIGVDSMKKKFPNAKTVARYVTRAAISQLFAVPYLESVASSLGDEKTELGSSSRSAAGSANTGNTGGPGDDVPNDCAKCGKSGNASTALMRCGQCRMVMYCGAECQRSHWKNHKVMCKQFTEMMAGLAG